MNDRVVSERFPYLPLVVVLNGRETEIEALIDTGFDGDLALPESFVSGMAPQRLFRGALADGSPIVVPAFDGRVRVGALGVVRARIAALGDEFLVGRGVTDHFTLILDHGRQVIIEP